MAFFKTITQGGQVHIHQLRMFKQILLVGFIVALLVGAGNFIWKSYQLPIRGWQALQETTWAKFMLATVPQENHKTLSQLYTPPKGKPYQRSCLSILNDPHLKKTTHVMEKTLESIAIQSLQLAGCTFFVIMGFWFFYGQIQKRNQHRRGNTIETPKKLRSLIKKRREASDLKLGKLPLLKNKETSHILMTGTTGSGKTNTFHILLPQIRKRKNRALIMDITGDYVARYYNKKTDIILNPLDVRSPHWHPWADCYLDSHYDVLAESFIQSKDNTKDPFWDNASRVVFKTALRKFAFQGEQDVQKLYAFLMSSSDKEFEDFFKNTEAATFTFKNNDKTTHSIRSVLSSQIECLRHLDGELGPEKPLLQGANSLQAQEGSFHLQKQAFSIRNWVMDEKQKGWLFMTARPDQRETLRPLISAWMDVAINALMVLPENKRRRLWFVMDELAALQRLPRLQTGLAESRKYGGCFLIGFQSKPQLEDIYGRNAAESMLDLFNTKVFFRCTEPSTQQWISKVLGDKEEIEPIENISYGANSTRDGVSLSHHTHQKPLVMPAELSQLRDLECYLKLPSDYPCTRLLLQYQKSPHSQKEVFLLKPEKKRDYAIQLSHTQDFKKEKIQ